MGSGIILVKTKVGLQLHRSFTGVFFYPVWRSLTFSLHHDFPPSFPTQSTMSKELSTLVIVVLKGQHLIDNHTFYKQGPYVKLSQWRY
jgi:hypothetical protein